MENLKLVSHNALPWYMNRTNLFGEFEGSLDRTQVPLMFALVKPSTAEARKDSWVVTFALFRQGSLVAFDSFGVLSQLGIDVANVYVDIGVLNSVANLEEHGECCFVVFSVLD